MPGGLMVLLDVLRGQANGDRAADLGTIVVRSYRTRK